MEEKQQQVLAEWEMKVFIIEQIDDGEKLEKLISLVKNHAS